MRAVSTELSCNSLENSLATMASSSSSVYSAYSQDCQLAVKFQQTLSLLEGTTENPANARIALKKMIASNFVPAILYAAESYRIGQGSFRCSATKSHRLYLLAAKLNDVTGAHAVANNYEKGLGIGRNYGKALQYHKKAAALGNTKSMYMLGIRSLEGSHGTERNRRTAAAWLSLAIYFANGKYSDAQYALACCFEPTQSVEEDSFIPDAEYSYRLYSSAANNGHTPSQYRLGKAYEKEELLLEKDITKAMHYYELAAANNYAEAQLALSGLFLITSNEISAFSYALKAANNGLPQAQFAIGYYYEKGVGMPECIKQAQEWYIRAAKAGSSAAKKRLKALKLNK